MLEPPNSDWTSSAAKWAAVLLLGTASLAGLAWSIFASRPRPVFSPAVVGRPAIASVPEAPPPESSGGATRVATAPDMTEGPLLAIPAAAPQVNADKTPASQGLARLVNINTAEAAELELLPGIGPGLAARIIEHRRLHGTFKSVDELDHVSGIGPRILEKVRPHATVR